MASLSTSVVASASSRLWNPAASNGKISVPSASLSLRTGSRQSPSSSLTSSASSQLLHCSFLSSPLSLASPFSGLSIAFDLSSQTSGLNSQRRRGLVVRAGKAALCQTKRSRSRKSLARTHGFRRRMRTTSGRATIKRRRAKGRWNLCPKSNPSSGKRA
ncbi:Ribosomal protein L34 [Arabidopsis thaliana x Arabidopsis arenosa]|uniref:Large ribosomal subunit protein bL34c n=1 Tax=Arabidopsis thaliana x Arabidopsis arenosa TaxID=1240361 RepID=A0A8T2BZP1_9BRAS|nr:Ribosomal protein L34 [Arabidopsis thaliana x Arabidopsis arenosa]